MSNRWKMNRIGFINFWLYDEEEFEFYDGKLLLRGQNGSGKSITTQSFIPFVLDGDRTPSRLDPFGSSDRRMEYYFLGEEGKDEATGYLYLEFQKEDAKEYRTIGIGQRAKRGKPMEFWGFVILDGRRIGRDLWPYKETGSVKIPYGKREMKEALGEGNLFADSQSEYKKMVNQSLFGFRKEEQYEQFIRLLVKVRAPKLSKEFKPTKVYEILNESLQTLSDEDLRTMVEAMEKMDEIQDSLEMLQRAFANVRSIRTEYARYNQYMLAKKAQAFLRKREEAGKAKREHEECLREMEQLRSDLKKLSDSLEELSQQIKILDTERSGLLDTDLEEMDSKLALARKEKEELEGTRRRLEARIDACKARIYQKERDVKDAKDCLEQDLDLLQGQRKDMEDCQELLRWEGHGEVARWLDRELADGAEALLSRLMQYKKSLEACKRALHELEEISRKYDEIAEELERVRKEKAAKEQAAEEAASQVVDCQDDWIRRLYAHAKAAKCWTPPESLLQEAEGQVRQYRGIADEGQIWERFRKDYEGQRALRLEEKQAAMQQVHLREERLGSARQELEDIRNRAEIEPERSEDTLRSRQRLSEAGIDAIPFYRAVERAEDLEDAECARLEAQLGSMGLLDALVVSEQDYGKIAKLCPSFLDTVIYAPQWGASGFSKLEPSEDLSPELTESVRKILSNIHEGAMPSPGNGPAAAVSGVHPWESGSGVHPGEASSAIGPAAAVSGICLGEDGRFLQGALAGKAGKQEAEYLGYLARKRKKEQCILALQQEIEETERELGRLRAKADGIEQGMALLAEEYAAIPGLEGLAQALDHERELAAALEHIAAEYARQEHREQECAARKQESLQKVLKACKPFPYGRSEQEYEEALDALDEYHLLLRECKELLLKLETERSGIRAGQEYLEQEEQNLDDAFVDCRSCDARISECDVRIRQYEEYLSRPEIAEKAQRLAQLQSERDSLTTQEKACEEERIRKDQTLEALRRAFPQKQEAMQVALEQEEILRQFFSEELGLGLVMEQGQETLADCAKEALRRLREGDKAREYGEMLQALVQSYQKNNGSLAQYGTAIEECFDSVGDRPQITGDFQPLRKRVRLVSTWNGKKVFLEEFYQILKTAIEETETLIQQKDRELFEDILSQTISRQLTDKIAESRGWVKDMSQLMQQLDTSMGLQFSLDWKPHAAGSEAELDTLELEQILLRDRSLLTVEDIEKVAGHFRSKIRMEKLRLEEEGGLINYMELVRDALDYRKWFEFQMFYRQGEERRKPLTNAAFNRFSGGEKAMAMYVPLFAAVNAQYKKADYADHPRIIALDEAFAGVDDKNISSMFELVGRMDLDYIMNSQSLWGCYETVKGIKIAELHRPMNSQVVTVIRYLWNGHERILDEQ